MRAVVLILVLAGGCATTHWQHDHFQRYGVPKAAFDLNCPAEQLEQTQLTPNSYGVRGCGQQARYDYVDGKWYLDAASREADQPTPASDPDDSSLEPLATTVDGAATP